MVAFIVNTKKKKIVKMSIVNIDNFYLRGEFCIMKHHWNLMTL